MEGTGMPTFGASTRHLHCGLKHSLPDADPVPDIIDAFQRHAAELLADLLVLPDDNPAADILSLAWTRRLLDAFLLCLKEFRFLLFVGSRNGESPAARPPLDRLVADFFDRAVKGLDLCNAVSNGLVLVQRWHKRLSIAAAVLTSQLDHATLLGRIRRARKTLADLTVLTLDDSHGEGGLVGQSNRSLGRAKATKEEALPHGHGDDLKAQSRPWSAARQLQAIGEGLPVPRPHDDAATGGLASAVYTMGAVLFIVSFALVATIPCQDRGLQAHFSVPRNFLISGPVTTLYDRIVKESKKKERRNSCGLLKEIQQIELCSRHFMESTDAAVFPLPGEKEAEVQETALDLVQLCECLKDELGPLQRRVREMFHKIVLTCTEILDGPNLKNRLQVTDTVHRPIGMETLVNRGMSTGGNSPVTVTKLLDQGHSMDISAAPSQQQRLMTSAPGQAAPQARKLPRPSILSTWWTHRAASASIPMPHRDPNRLPDQGPQARVPTEHPLSVAEGPQESSTEVTMNPSGGTMETPVSSSLGAMGPLLRKVHLLLTPMYPLRRSVKHAIQLLKEDLEDINDALVEQSMVDSPNNKGKYWVHEVRELSYDVEDAIDAMMLPYTAADGKVRVRPVHGNRIGRLKIKGLPNMLKPLTRIVRVTELRTVLWEASERHQRYELDVCISNPSFLFSGHSGRIPVTREVAGNLVGIDAPRDELTTWLTARAEQLKVLCIVGPAGVGKTALAKELYRELGSRFECRAFVRVSRTPHMSRLLLGILSQIQRPKQNSDTCSVPNIIDEIRKHLQDKRYFIVIDGLWEARVWDIIKSAFPKGHNCSRIMITCEVKDVATKFCSYHCIDVFELKPLGSQDSEKLFFDTMSGFNVQCHDQLKEVSCRILRECAGLPLATIAIAGLLASQPDNSDLWHHLLQYFSSDLANLTLDELLKGTVNLCYNILPQDLKTCLLYLTMYPEGCTIRKVDLLKQWIAEGFITPTTEGKEGVAENYFAELVNRGMIQPEKIMHNDEVLSCTVHHIVFDLIMHKSREENFTTAVDYSQTVTEFFMKVYRLSLHFSCAQYATKLEGIRLSQIRSLSFFGLLRCMPSVTQLRLLRVLILEFWDDNDGCISLNLSRISGLVLLRYLKISSHLLVELPSKIQELKFLETLEIDARVWSVPDDIVRIPGLVHLSIQDEAKLPEGIGSVTSLQTLQYFDLGNNSEDNVRSLCELINLRDLHITCSTALSDAHLKRKFVVLAASLPKLTNLRSLTMAPGAVSTTMFVDYSSAMLSTPMFLQRLELLPPICIFSRLPVWVGKLKKLRILKIVVRVLLSSDIDVLTGLPGLTVLSLYIRQPNTQRVVFSSGALPVLKYFKYTCGALFLAFQEEALPNLERLKLRFNVHKDEMYYHMNSGIENLLNLKEMTVKIGAADGATESDKKAAESAIKSDIRKHPRFPIYMNVRRIGWVEEE